MCELRSTAYIDTSAELLRLLTCSINSKKFKVLNCDLGKPIGYIAWADINEETLFRLKYLGQFPKYFYEWSEGDIRLIVDLVIVGGIKRIGYRRLINFYKAANKCAYIRKDKIIFNDVCE